MSLTHCTPSGMDVQGLTGPQALGKAVEAHSLQDMMHCAHLVARSTYTREASTKSELRQTALLQHRTPCRAPCEDPADSRSALMRCLAGSDPVTGGGRPLPLSTSGLLLPRSEDCLEPAKLTTLPDSATLHTPLQA